MRHNARNNAITIVVYSVDADGCDVEEDVELPSRWEVCERCRGNGSHVNPSIDGNGITSSEWEEWDDDEREGYFRGDYDVVCEECGGRSTTLVVDEDRLTPEQREQWEAHCTEQRAISSEAAYWRRLEAHACGEY